MVGKRGQGGRGGGKRTRPRVETVVVPGKLHDCRAGTDGPLLVFTWDAVIYENVVAARVACRLKAQRRVAAWVDLSRAGAVSGEDEGGQESEHGCVVR